MLPQGEKTRRAVRWISDILQENPQSRINELVMRAISRFDLNPKESEELSRFYRRAKQE